MNNYRLGFVFAELSLDKRGHRVFVKMSGGSDRLGLNARKKAETAMDHRANYFHLSFCSWSRHVCLRGSFELRSSRLYFFQAVVRCPQVDALAKIFRRKVSTNFDLGRRQSMLLTQTGLEMI